MSERHHPRPHRCTSRSATPPSSGCGATSPTSRTRSASAWNPAPSTPTPVSPYVALVERLPGYPDHDVALLWVEPHGWTAAVETQSSEDLILVRYLGGITIIPPPPWVAGFVKALREDDHRIGLLDAVSIRTAAGFAEMDAVVRERTSARASRVRQPT
ncbi:hypothetical protein Amsp01_043180 [Amycolatopsis sp. NBRC 101858]|uniref:DUF6292 family protein n=1 Tax=Amycolatopsis sp. NBRC 101858 TaxID=3032200 RepID=UPI0024A4E21C|nr:DUF6292 family protein [Amycolatopsis sp. NBRC 101858]GLY38294.1 hypothetical protein Amsp01_043180 [Amycolatopsis sp. NBRC 101858]